MFFFSQMHLGCKIENVYHSFGNDSWLTIALLRLLNLVRVVSNMLNSTLRVQSLEHSPQVKKGICPHLPSFDIGLCIINITLHLTFKR